MGKNNVHVRLRVVCETPGCRNNGKVVNIIGAIPPEAVNILFEGFGHGAEDPNDYCPECQQLGILQD
jgi:hypothetical protein